MYLHIGSQKKNNTFRLCVCVAMNFCTFSFSQQLYPHCISSFCSRNELFQRGGKAVNKTLPVHERQSIQCFTAAQTCQRWERIGV